MWLAVINRNVNEMKQWATELGVGDLYPFLACIMTHKPWTSIVNGIDKKVDKATAEREVLFNRNSNYQITILFFSIKI